MIKLDDLKEMLQELRVQIQSIKGVKSLEEGLTLTYFAEVGAEEDKEAVEKVSSVLAGQAKRFGFELEVIPITTVELEATKEQLVAHLANQSKFKV